MSGALMEGLRLQVVSLKRVVDTLGSENTRVRELLAEFDLRHDRDQAEITRLRGLLEANGIHPNSEFVRDGLRVEAPKGPQEF